MYKEEDETKNGIHHLHHTLQQGDGKYDYGIIIVVYAFSDNTWVMAEAVNVRRSPVNVRVHTISLNYY